MYIHVLLIGVRRLGRTDDDCRPSEMQMREDTEIRIYKEGSGNFSYGLTFRGHVITEEIQTAIRFRSLYM